MGKGSQKNQKSVIFFLEKSTKSGLVCDISSDEHNRIYGENWYRFLSESKFTLGVEAGVSIVDLSGEVLKQVDKYKDSHPECKFSELHDNVLFPYEDNMFYRTISPRIFEAAAFKVCLILFLVSTAISWTRKNTLLNWKKTFQIFMKFWNQLKTMIWSK